MAGRGGTLKRARFLAIGGILAFLVGGCVCQFVAIGARAREPGRAGCAGRPERTAIGRHSRPYLAETSPRARRVLTSD